MRFASLGSGSRGNALIVESAGTRILIDCGITLRNLTAGLERLDLSPDDLQAAFITHEHGDHIKGVKALARKHLLPVYMTHGTAVKSGCDELPQVMLIDSVSPINVGGLSVQPVVVPHDAREPCQFVITAKVHDSKVNGSQVNDSKIDHPPREKRLGVLTDLGSYTPHVIDAYNNCDAMVLECNHDVGMLEAGSYPYSLKRRVLGDWGHLSNHQARNLLSHFDHEKIQWLVVAHISQQNNTETLALDALQDVFPYHERILVADQDTGFDWLQIS